MQTSHPLPPHPWFSWVSNLTFSQRLLPCLVPCFCIAEPCHFGMHMPASLAQLPAMVRIEALEVLLSPLLHGAVDSPVDNWKTPVYIKQPLIHPSPSCKMLPHSLIMDSSFHGRAAKARLAFPHFSGARSVQACLNIKIGGQMVPSRPACILTHSLLPADCPATGFNDANSSNVACSRALCADLSDQRHLSSGQPVPVIRGRLRTTGDAGAPLWKAEAAVLPGMARQALLETLRAGGAGCRAVVWLASAHLAAWGQLPDRVFHRYHCHHPPAHQLFWPLSFLAA